jgi:hypothetical protein
MNEILLGIVILIVLVLSIVVINMVGKKTVTYDCTDNYSCKEVSGNTGKYKTLEECQNDCKRPTYKCNTTTYNCDKVYDNTGKPTEAECKANCTSPPPPPTPPTPTPPTPTPSEQTYDCVNGSCKSVSNGKYTSPTCNDECGSVVNPGVCTNLESGMVSERVVNCCGTDPMSDITFNDIIKNCKLDNPSELNKMTECCKGECSTLEECKQKYPCTTKYVDDLTQKMYSTSLGESAPMKYKLYLINRLLQLDSSDPSIGRREGGNVQCVNYIQPQDPEIRDYIKNACDRASQGENIGNIALFCNDKQPQRTIQFECENPVGIYKPICEICKHARDLKSCALFNIDKIIGKTEDATCTNFNRQIGGSGGMSRLLNNNFPCRKCLIAKYKKSCGEIPMSLTSVHGTEGYEPFYQS